MKCTNLSISFFFFQCAPRGPLLTIKFFNSEAVLTANAIKPSGLFAISKIKTGEAFPNCAKGISRSKREKKVILSEFHTIPEREKRYQ